jgi:endonuclease YncB( thermonuclease family)
MHYKVINVINVNTFEVLPPWRWNDQSGIRVRPAGYYPPEEKQFGFEKAKDKLKLLLSGREVELKNFVDIDYDCLVCDVILDGRNLIDIFPEYKEKSPV